MMLSREQFDILVAMTELKSVLNQEKLEEKLNLPAETINRVLVELKEIGYIYNGALTKNGISALEPYRAKRAIFIAAGLGSRLAPITLNTPKPLIRVHGVRIIDRLIDACLETGIEEIYIVRGYLSEQFDQLLYKYPVLKFLENPLYKDVNNIGSSLTASHLLSNAYVFEADLLISNSKIIRKYHYTSDFLAIKKEHTDDWCFEVKDGIIVKEKVGGENCWQMVGISYWNEADGYKLSKDIPDVYASPGGKEVYWEQVPLVYKKEHFSVEVCECFDNDIVEIDTFEELKAIDHVYDISI